MTAILQTRTGKSVLPFKLFHNLKTHIAPRRETTLSRIDLNSRAQERENCKTFNDRKYKHTRTET